MASAGSPQQQILICGGGNASHVVAALAASLDNTRVHVLSLYEDEAERWNTAMRDAGGVTAVLTAEENKEVTAMADLVTKDPAAAIPNSDVIIITVPAFAHQTYLEAINEHLNKEAIICVLPGSGGLEFQFAKIFGDKGQTVALAAAETLPWACRFVVYGARVDVLGTKAEVAMTCLIGSRCGFDEGAIYANLQRIIGKCQMRNDGHIIGCTLGNHPEVHCAIMYDKWQNYDGSGLAENPLFYQGITQEGANLMAELSNECLAIGEAVKTAKPGIEFKMGHIQEWFEVTYGQDVADSSSLFKLITTNPSYNGLTHPCKQNEDGLWFPNFNHRYLGEDIPYGFVVFKGVALMVGVETPLMDRVLLWAQERMGKEYMVDGQLTGRNMGETRAPQVYGFATLDEIFPE